MYIYIETGQWFHFGRTNLISLQGFNIYIHTYILLPYCLSGRRMYVYFSPCARSRKKYVLLLLCFAKKSVFLSNLSFFWSFQTNCSRAFTCCLLFLTKRIQLELFFRYAINMLVHTKCIYVKLKQQIINQFNAFFSLATVVAVIQELHLIESNKKHTNQQSREKKIWSNNCTRVCI